MMISIEFKDTKGTYGLNGLTSDVIWDVIAAVDIVSEELALESLNKFTWCPDEGMDEDISEEDLIAGNFEIKEKWFKPDKALKTIQIYKDALKNKKIDNYIMPETMNALTIIEDALIDARECNKEFIFLVLG